MVKSHILIPYNKDPNFIGRGDILAAVAKLHKSGSPVALHGIGGVGYLCS